MKKLTQEEILEHLDLYLGHLADDPKVSETKWHHMKTAIIGCKMIVRGTHGYKKQKTSPKGKVSDDSV